MSAFVIKGGRRISGSLQVQGSKNSSLPIGKELYFYE